MKTLARLALLIFLLPMFINCSSDDSNARVTQELSLKAAINEICSTNINYNDYEDNVYGYRADEFFGVPSVQAGGHSDEDELTDLGVNIFVDLEALDAINYAIDGGSALPGTAYVFYFPGDGTQYISTGTNTNNLVIEILELNSDDLIVKLKGTFSNVEVANIMNPDDKLCINLFELIFTL